MRGDAPEYVLEDEVSVRRVLDGTRSRLFVLRPPFAALGIGKLRVLRVRDQTACVEVVAGYERYERLPEKR